MTADQRKPQFEPPPWEKEAFDRFHAERQAARAEEELASALQAMREEPSRPQEEPSAAVLPVLPTEVPPEATAGAVTSPAQPRIPEARIDAMLVQLRGEEGPTPGPSMKLINAAIAFMVAGGLLLVVQAIRLFAQSRGEGATDAALMFAGIISMLIVFTGAGFFGGAYMLFRKYHR